MAIKSYAIYKSSDGTLISEDTDDCAQRLTDGELAAKGFVRKEIPQLFNKDKIWDKNALSQKDKP